MLEEELALVENYIAFLDRFRSKGGLLIIPDGLTAPDDGYLDEDEESFEEQLIQAMMEPLTEDYDSSRFMGFIIKGPAELTDKIRHIDFDGEFRATLIARAYDIKKKIEELDKPE